MQIVQRWDGHSASWREERALERGVSVKASFVFGVADEDMV